MSTKVPRPCRRKPTSLANRPVSRVIHKFLEGEAVHVAVPENAGLTFLRGPLTAYVLITLMLLVWLVEFLKILIYHGGEPFWLVEVLNVLIQHGEEPFFHRFGELLNNPFTVSQRNAKGSLRRRHFENWSSLQTLGALDSLDLWNIDDFLESLQLRDLDCLLHDLHLRNMHDLDDWPVHQGAARAAGASYSTAGQVPRVPGAPQSVLERRTQPREQVPRIPGTP